MPGYTYFADISATKLTLTGDKIWAAWLSAIIAIDSWISFVNGCHNLSLSLVAVAPLWFAPNPLYICIAAATWIL